MKAVHLVFKEGKTVKLPKKLHEKVEPRSFCNIVCLSKHTRSINDPDISRAHFRELLKIWKTQRGMDTKTTSCVTPGASIMQRWEV